MPRIDKPTTTISTKGQVSLPAEIRRRRQWGSGTQLFIADTTQGVLLKSAAVFNPTEPAMVFGSLPHRGAPKTTEEMKAGIMAEARRRHARGRY